MSKSNGSSLMKWSTDFKGNNLFAVSPFTADLVATAGERMMLDELFEVENVLRNVLNEQNQQCNYCSANESFARVGRQTTCYLG